MCESGPIQEVKLAKLHVNLHVHQLAQEEEIVLCNIQCHRGGNSSSFNVELMAHVTYNG